MKVRGRFLTSATGLLLVAVAVGCGGGSSTGGTVTGLTAGVTYYFVVQSVNAFSHGPSSSEVSATPN